MVGLRMSPALRQSVDAWAKAHSPPLTFSDAIRALIENGLTHKPPKA